MQNRPSVRMLVYIMIRVSSGPSGPPMLKEKTTNGSKPYSHQPESQGRAVQSLGILEKQFPLQSTWPTQPTMVRARTVGLLPFSKSYSCPLRGNTCYTSVPPDHITHMIQAPRAHIRMEELCKWLRMGKYIPHSSILSHPMPRQCTHLSL